MPIADLGDLGGGVPGAPRAGSAGILPALGRHGGSRRQGAFLKPRHTRCGRDASARSQGEVSPSSFVLPRAIQPPLGLENRVVVIFEVIE